MLTTAFIFEENEIRTFVDDNNSPWFCAKDICDSLSITWNGKNTLSAIKEKWQIQMKASSKSGGMQTLLYINEPALYRFVSRSNKKEAEEFMDWVYETVLPSIRVQGWYAHANTIDSDILKNRLSIYEQKRKHISTIKDRHPSLENALIEDVRELCVMLGQQKPDVKIVQQVDLPLKYLE